MFRHTQRLQFEAKPDQPDPLYAKKLQELVGGAWGEMTVAMQYMFQGWNCRAPGKYKDMILDIGTEELGHVEMLATMIARLLEGAPSETTAGMVDNDPVLGAIVGGMDPQQAIVGGGGALPVDSDGTPWNGKYIVASGNLLADFRVNVAAESQGRLQTARLYRMTDDPGVKEMLKFNLARDTMHQLQWLSAIEQLQEDGLEGTIAPNALLDEENQQHNSTLWGLSDGTTADQGKWASGTAPDGQHEFSYLDQPDPLGDLASAPPPDPYLYATSETTAPNTEDRGIVGKVKDKLS
ncbi:manganese catalase family protein [Actinopolyspora saharensis]|uniref:Mn-containing catalase n=1 Tax=Actinopolyspora saharensis TaxID=995062 RepID=A0A1H1FTW5_9ACTN|nr:manganese catalase family protein [Actinopolyspora saharensis]SDR04437.1 Mn-containing catalase [Actinopolyspora saharensis]